MTGHWRLAFRCAGWMFLLAAIAVVVISYLYDKNSAVAFGYGAGVGLLSFVSTAATVTLLTGRSKVVGVVLGVGTFVARYAFVAIALGLPMYRDLWPALPALGGFAGVYFAETVFLVPWSIRTMRFPVAERPVDEVVERRAEV
ncbi:MAG TPA: hypothetical protein VHM69_16800 [Rubrobacter sp.]|nr:hypothetical protein [Rubrobacter sp.]